MNSAARNPKIRTIAATALKKQLHDGREIAVLDVREEGVFAKRHLLLAASAPLSRLEIRVPLLVPRSCTERPEGVATGFVRLVAVDCASIVREALALLAMPRATALPFDQHAPFGDGMAAARIVDILEASLAEAIAA